MRASEMISDLQKLIEQYGDLPVYWTDSEWGGPMYEVKDVTYESPQNWPSGQIPSPVFAVNYPDNAANYNSGNGDKVPPYFTISK